MSTKLSPNKSTASSYICSFWLTHVLFEAGLTTMENWIQRFQSFCVVQAHISFVMCVRQVTKEILENSFRPNKYCLMSRSIISFA